ncbi:MAG: RNA polymerase sigma factor [Planctomycetota bacterium]|jgi:RNA polymerase sigma-70 factor (ECF subfamily)
MDTELIADIIHRAKQHDPEAYDALVEEYSPRLYGYFYRLTGSQHDAEDLLQEVFVRLVRTFDDYQHQGRFEAWLFRIALNLLRDRVRRRKKSKSAGLMPQSLPTKEENDPLDNYPDNSAPQPQDDLYRAEQIDRMQLAIEKLPEPEREVIIMRHFSQMSFREIADTMNIPLGTALARAHRGLAKLRTMMEE